MTVINPASGSRRLHGSASLFGLTLWVTATACGGRFFEGGPDVAPGNYHTPGRPDMPLEDQFLLVEPSSIQVLNGQPPNPWRPLGDVQTEKTNAATAAAELKRLASRYGADGLVEVASGAGSVRRSRSGESFSLRGMNFDEDAGLETLETTFGIAGTALRRATPGTEAFLGIGCAGYSPEKVGKLGPHDLELVPYVTSATGPAAAAKIEKGDFIMVWQVEESEDVVSSNCAGLNEALRLAGPGKTVHFTLWRPSAEAVEMNVRVPHPRIIGADINPAKEGGLRVDEVLAKSPAEKAGVQVGDFLVSIGGTAVTDIKVAVQLIRSGPKLQQLGITRAGKSMTIPVQSAPLTSIHVRDVASGVLVAWVYSAGKTEEGDLQPGDFLLDYSSSEQFEQALAQADDGEMMVRVRREGTPRAVSVKLDRIPDARYREGTALYVRKTPLPPDAATTVTADAAATPASSATPSAAAIPLAGATEPVLPPLRGCGTDLDCKGDRVCEKNECTDPKPKTVPAPVTSR